MSEEDYADFISAVTGEFAETLAGVCNLTPQDCFDPLLEVYGLEFNPARLHDTTEKQIHELAESFAEEFECQVPDELVRDAVTRSKARWPA